MSLYQDPRGRTKRTWLDWLLLLVVVGIAILVIITSFHNTSKLAKLLAMPPILMATVVEIAYATFLFLRARQKALGLKTPVFLHVLYYITFGLVTAVNMWGLFIEHKIWGLIIGGAISFLMWGFETTLVWFWTRSREPYSKGFARRVFDLIRNRIKAKIEAIEEKEAQKIAWIKYDARRPGLKLVQKIRKEENKRKKVIGDDLPEFFKYLEQQGNIEEIVAELNETEPKTIEVSNDESAIIPMRRPIGFHAELSNIQTEPQAEGLVISTIEHPSNTSSNISSNTSKVSKKEQAKQYVLELLEQGLEQGKDFSVSSVANTVGCARSTASLAIREAREAMK